MFYRVDATMIFLDPDEARDFKHDAELALPKATVINPGEPNEEYSFYRLQKCYHDSQPSRACDTLEYADNKVQ